MPPSSASRLRAVGLGLVAAAVVAVLAATLTPGDPTVSERPPITCLVCGASGLVDVTLNLLLFLPLGAGLGLLGWPVRRALAAGLALSLLVESAQLLVLAGRDPSLSDLLFDATGAAVGCALARGRRRWLAPEPRTAGRLAAAAALAWAAVLAVTAAGLALDMERPPYFLNALGTQAMRTVRPYEGTVVRSTVLGTDAPAPSHASAPRFVDPPGPPAPPYRLEAEAHAMLPPGMLRPLAALHTVRGDELLVLGQQGRALVVRARTRAVGWRLLATRVALDDAFPPAAAIPPGHGPARGPLVRVAGTVTRRAVRLEAAWGEARRAVTVPRSPLLGWTFFGVFGLRYGRYGPWLTAGWVAALLLPGAFWASRAARAAARPPARARPLLLYAVATLGTMALVPAASGLAFPRLADWGAAGLALAAGYAIAGVRRRVVATPSAASRAS